ncbi:hypothetical protein EF847_03825 [Actinobacteria bacterium YIM 96077]|uniref:Uncharacterized protein n=1 Tax=Phytoactinopolyspora halophila TaxID=1981511 RepID=A0A329R2N8_9ACTN|nr:PPA1309 family protein [Phytoactinopolyspora halophila]AYY11965.1 hypothetical protein EF847_03825 [Actinobacteria bacterium YIM 96077]RAW18801.1 hypothetical protein DPM12_01685 [Phytoactinopolyspora halophila]
MSNEQNASARTAAATSPLARAVTEIEQHVTANGWDQQPRLYALAPTADLVEREPDLAERLGLTQATAADGSLTPIEQDLPDQPIEDLLPTITWPDSVDGCVLAIERIVLPPGAEEHVPDDDTAAIAWAQNHPNRTDVRVVVGVLRDGSRTCVVRVRGYEQEDELIHDAELSAEIGNALADTFT